MTGPRTIKEIGSSFSTSIYSVIRLYTTSQKPLRLRNEQQTSHLPPEFVSPAVVSARVPNKILLVVILSFEPFRGGCDLSHDLLPLGIEVVFLDLGGDFPRHSCLLLGSCENGGAVLASVVVALSVDGGWVMSTVEELYELPIGDNIRIELDPASFCMSGPTTAYFTVVRLCHLIPSDETNASLQNSFVLLDGIVLEDDVLCSPETSIREDGDFGCGSCVRHWTDTCIMESLFGRCQGNS